MTARIAAVLVLALSIAACSHPASPGAPAPVAAPAPPPAPPAPPPAKTVQLNAPGEPVDVIAALPAGYVSVVDFWAESCKACVTYGDMLTAGVAGDPRIVIRKVDVGDGLTPVARAYEIGALPHFRIYDKRKRLRYDLVGSDCAQATAFARQLADE